MLMLRFISNMFTAFILLYILFDSKYNSRKTLTILLSGWLGIILIDVIYIMIFGYDTFYRFYPLLVHIPSFILFTAISKHKGFKLLFNILTVIALSTIIVIMGGLISASIDGSIAWEIIGRMITFLIVFFVVNKYFKDTYITMLNTMDKGWALFCIVPFCSYLISYFVSNKYNYTFSKEDTLIFLLAFIAVIATYIVTLNFFSLFDKQHQQTLQNQQLNQHLIAIKQQHSAIVKAEQKVQILRHDMRHFKESVSALIESGDTKSALSFIVKNDKKYKETKIIKYCENFTINAILSYYFKLIIDDGIDLEHKLDIPKEINIDEMELSNVFANALENAHNAVKKLPPDSIKRIQITCFYQPQFIIEVSNTFNGNITINKNGLPTSKEKNHGIGTKSIKAFADKHNAILDYKITENTFRLRLLIAKNN